MYAKGGAAIARDRAEFVCNTNSQPTIVPLVPGAERVGNRRDHVFNLGTDRHNVAGIVADMHRDGYISTVGLRFASVATRVRTHDNSLRSARRSSG